MRLYRPHVPLSVRIKVVQRQLAEREARDPGVRYPRPSTGWTLANQLRFLLEIWAEILPCEVKDLRLDHDPPLGARPQERRGLGRKVYYIPDANDPEHLNYRPHGPQFEGSHLIKTNVRGEHGQHPDRVLIKKMRRIERGPRDKPKRKWASRPFQTTSKGKSRWKT
jgi:hypothetical protein